MELEWIVAELRALDHNVQRWDAVIAEWGEPRKDLFAETRLVVRILSNGSLVTSSAVPVSISSGRSRLHLLPTSGERMHSKPKGARRIVVDGVPYFWRVPRRANGLQKDHEVGLFAVVWHAQARGAKLLVFCPIPHPQAAVDAFSMRPSDIARGIREGLARGWRPSEPGPARAVGDSRVLRATRE
jgi:hypothetical protein